MLFVILLWVAGTTWVLGWLVLIADAITGFKLIEKLPTNVMAVYEAIHKAAWIGVGVIVLAVAIVMVSGLWPGGVP